MATDYQVVKGKSIAVLVTRVKEQIALGWEPIGALGYVVNEFDGEGYLVQAMIKV